MSTLRQLMDQVEINLQGYVQDQAEQTFVADPMDGDDLTFTVDDASQVSRGIIQVDDELMWAKSVDRTNNTVTVSPFGRGYLSTTAASHAAGARVTDNPLIPRSQIKIAINQVLENIYPDLYVLATTNITYVAARATYEMPTTARNVTSVSWQTVGPTQYWEPLKRWEFNPRADLTQFPTGRSIDLWSPIVHGRTVKVDYITRPSDLVNPTDEFTGTGLETYVETTVIYGTCYRMVGWLDAPRLQTRAVETSQRSAYVAAGAAADTAKYFYALYQQSLEAARLRFLKENPTGLHFKTR
jgi:hypothetical protein